MGGGGGALIPPSNAFIPLCKGGSHPLHRSRGWVGGNAEASEGQGGVLHTQTYVYMLKPILFHPIVITIDIKTDVAAHLHAVGQSGVVVLAVVVLRLLDHQRRRSGRFVASGALEMGKM